VNTILLVLDALRYDHVTSEITPNLMKHIKRSASFTDAHSCNTSTIESMPYIISGQKEYAPEKNIATALNGLGVHTAMIHSNPMIHAFYPGFKETIDLKSKQFKMSKGFRKSLRRNLPPSIIRQLKKVRASVQEDDAYLPYARADETLIFTEKWMKENDNYFLWAHLMDPHIPYYPMKTQTGLSKHEMRTLNDKIIESVHNNYDPTSEETQIALQLYKEDISEMDRALGPLLENVPDDTLLIITADHGEEFGEHGQYSHHDNKFYPELTHVPLIISGPGIKPQTVIERVSTDSIAATIIEIYELGDSLGDSTSLYPMISK